MQIPANRKIHLLHKELMNTTHLITVSVIGIGGTGTHVLTNLAMINYSLRALSMPGIHVIALDPDIVTEANIGRQVFSPADIGRYKSDVLIERINRYYGYEWESIPAEFESGPYPANIVISCVDSVIVRKRIAKFVHNYVPNTFFSTERTYYYWMDIGNNARSGQIILGTRSSKFNNHKDNQWLVKDLPDFTDEFKRVKTNKSQPSCSVAEALLKQDLFINKIIATYATHMLWQLLKEKYLTYRGIYINLETMRTNNIEIV